jgi:hypothetical protein
MPKVVNSSQYKEYKFQTDHLNKLKTILSKNHVALDSSETGLGKTKCAIQLAIDLNKQLFIGCPKPAIITWYRELKKMNALDRVLTVSNYEVLRNGKWFDVKEELNRWIDEGYDLNEIPEDFWTDMRSKPCDYLEKLNIKKPTSKNPYGQREVTYEWSVSLDTIIVFDESHKSKNSETTNAKLLITATDYVRSIEDPSRVNPKVLQLSATPIEIEKNIRTLLYSLGYIKNLDRQITLDTKKIHEILYTGQHARASRMTTEQKELELGRDASSHQLDISVEGIPVSDKDRIQVEEKDKQIRQILDGIETKKKTDKKSTVVNLLRLRQELESIKLPEYARIARQKISEGFSVVVFLNFRESVEYLDRIMKDVPKSKIIGGQSGEERWEAENWFQTNRVKLILCTITSGNASISLHDTSGTHPRFSLISVSWSATDFKQIFGRTNRLGGESVPVYRIMYFKGTVEESVAKSMSQKLNQMSNLNDGSDSDQLFVHDSPRVGG